MLLQRHLISLIEQPTAAPVLFARHPCLESLDPDHHYSCFRWISLDLQHTVAPWRYQCRRTENGCSLPGLRWVREPVTSYWIVLSKGVRQLPSRSTLRLYTRSRELQRNWRKTDKGTAISGDRTSTANATIFAMLHPVDKIQTRDDIRGWVQQD